MIDQPAYIKQLLEKYLAGTATPVELARLLAAWDIYDDEELSNMIAEITGDDQCILTAEGEHELPVEVVPAASMNESSLPATEALKKRSRFEQLSSIATVMIIVCWLIWFFLKPVATTTRYYCDGVPLNIELPTAPYHCKLLLANGRQLFIDSSLQGHVTQEGDVTITQPEPGLLVYERRVVVKKEDSKQLYHTIVTPPGQQYRVALPDGTQLRLNAASTIRIPVVNLTGQRVVHLVGEAFFDVVPMNTAPFSIYTGNTDINVAEGRLNVNAYARKTSATVLSGSFDIKSGSQMARLTAGKKPLVVVNTNQAGNRLIPAVVDSLTVVSWKKTIRTYQNVSMRDFVADMGRWYNLDIRNVGCIPAAAHISINICYNAPLEIVFTIFKDNKLQFHQVGNRITFCDTALGREPAQPVPFKQTL